MAFEPWAREAEDGTPSAQRLTDLFAAVPEPEALSEIVRQRVGARLRRRTPRSAGLMLVRLVAVGAVIGIAGAAAAQWTAQRWFVAKTEAVTVPSVVKAVPLAPRPVSRPRASAMAPEMAAAPLPSAPASAAFAELPPAPAPTQSSRLGLEAASLEAALSTLRGGNRSAALSALETHLRAFPGGALELEARVARVDALLALGRRQEARRELSALPIESVGRKAELRLIRAELRADDDCRAALSDFQVLVAQPLQAAWAERALFGSGACRLKLGDRVGAEHDFARYLTQFPNGRFAEQIRAQRAR